MLGWAVLAGESAEAVNELRVDSTWEFAASSFMSELV